VSRRPLIHAVFLSPQLWRGAVAGHTINVLIVMHFD